MECEQRLGRDRKILAARFAAEPKGAGRTATLIHGRAFAMNAHNASGPTQALEGRFGFRIRPAHDLHQGERAGLGGKEEVLGYLVPYPSQIRRI